MVTYSPYGSSSGTRRSTATATAASRQKKKVVPKDYLSLLLNPDTNNAASNIAGFVETVKSFEPGAFPGHCYAVRELGLTKGALRRSRQLGQTVISFSRKRRWSGVLRVETEEELWTPPEATPYLKMTQRNKLAPLVRLPASLLVARSLLYMV